MRTVRRRMGWLAAAACLGLAVACNAVSGLDKLSFTGNTTGTGASSSSGTMSSSGSSGTGGADAGPPPATVWARSFGNTGDAATGKQTVNAIAVAGPGGMFPGHVFLTGRGNALAGLGCTNEGTGSIGYLVELDVTGKCVWGYGFGDTDAEGFGVAVDPANGYIALTGTFMGNATVQGWPMTATSGFRSAFVAVFQSNRMPLWVLQLGAMGGDPSIAGASMDGPAVIVGGSFASSLDVSYPTSSMATPPPSDLGGNGARTGFALVFKQGDGSFVQDFTVDGSSSSQSQQIEGVALSAAAGRYAFAGTGSGDTSFNGTPVTAGNGPNTFLGSYRPTDNHTYIQLVLEGGLAQTGQHVALYDGGDALLGGAYSAGTLDVGGKGPTGPTLTTTTNGSVVVARYNGAGAPVAIQLASDTSTDTATIGGLALSGTGAPDAGGSVVFAGGFTDKAILLKAPPITATAGTKSAVYVAKVDATLGAVVWLQGFGDGHAEQAADAVAVDPADGSVLVAGHFLDTLDFGANAGSVKHAGVSSTTPDIFVVKLVP